VVTRTLPPWPAGQSLGSDTVHVAAREHIVWHGAARRGRSAPLFTKRSSPPHSRGRGRITEAPSRPIFKSNDDERAFWLALAAVIMQRCTENDSQKVLTRRRQWQITKAKEYTVEDVLGLRLFDVWMDPQLRHHPAEPITTARASRQVLPPRFFATESPFP
jgi:hypothetical protein